MGRGYYENGPEVASQVNELLVETTQSMFNGKCIT